MEAIPNGHTHLKFADFFLVNKLNDQPQTKV
jgi:hypothetical protein